MCAWAMPSSSCPRRSCRWRRAPGSSPSFGFDLSYAILASLGTYCALLLLHLLARRADADGEAEDIAADEGDVHWQTGAAAFEAALARQDAQAAAVPAGACAAPRTRPAPGPTRCRCPRPRSPDASQAFKFRPSRLPYFEPGERPGRQSRSPPASTRCEPEARLAPPEINVEVIQDLIKKLADELNGPIGRDAGRGGPGRARAPRRCSAAR